MSKKIVVDGTVIKLDNNKIIVHGNRAMQLYFNHKNGCYLGGTTINPVYVCDAQYLAEIIAMILVIND